jgi:hypothetical protein
MMSHLSTVTFAGSVSSGVRWRREGKGAFGSGQAGGSVVLTAAPEMRVTERTKRGRDCGWVRPRHEQAGRRQLLRIRMSVVVGIVGECVVQALVAGGITKDRAVDARALNNGTSERAMPSVLTRSPEQLPTDGNTRTEEVRQ